MAISLSPEAGRPLRWLLTATHVPPNGVGGGMIRYTVEFSRALVRRPDVELSLLVAPDAAVGLAEVLGVPPGRVHVLGGSVITASLRQRLAVGFDANGFDVFHGAKHLVPRRSRARRLLVVHDLVPFERPADFGRAKRYLLPRQYATALDDADALPCDSRATHDKLVARFPHLAAKATVVSLAMSPTLLSTEPRPIPNLVDQPFALVVGDASPRKNLRLVADIWPAVRRRRPELLLAIAGPAGWGVLAGLEQLDDLVTNNAAVRLGHISDAELRWAYEHAAVVLCPSRLEGFGLPALEAVTFGAPLVISPDPALVEVAGDAACVVRLDDPLGWVDAICGIAGARSPAMRTGSPRTWDDVAAETVAVACALH